MTGTSSHSVRSYWLDGVGAYLYRPSDGRTAFIHNASG